jgi:hypothetical protein
VILQPISFFKEHDNEEIQALRPRNIGTLPPREGAFLCAKFPMKPRIFAPKGTNRSSSLSSSSTLSSTSFARATSLNFVAM